MKTLRTGFLLAVVFAARWSMGQEAPPDAPPAPPPAEPAQPPSTPPETPPAPSEPPAPAPTEAPPPGPAPSATGAFPSEPAPAPSSSASFPTPAPTVAPAASASTAVAPPPVVPPPPKAEAQKKSDKKDKGAKKDEKEAEKDDTNGVFGPFRIGPIVGIGLPSFLMFGGAIKLTKYFGAGLNYGIVPELQFAYYGDATVRYQGVNLYGHIHPFGGGFFLGAAIGYAHVNGTYEETFDVSAYASQFPPGFNVPSKLPYKSEATVQMLVLTPEIGYFYTFKAGFTVGVDAGLQIPVAPSEIQFKSHVDSDIPDAVVQKFIEPTDERVRSTLERVGQTILPTFGLKIGWLF